MFHLRLDPADTHGRSAYTLKIYPFSWTNKKSGVLLKLERELSE